MKILKIENHDYKIIYINDNEVYNAYRRFNKTKWQKYSTNKNTWYDIDNLLETEKLEKAYENSSIG